MKQPCEELRDPIEQTHQAEGQRNYQNYHLFDSHKMTDQGEDFQEEEDSPEEGDTQAVEEYHLEGHQEAVGDHHCYLCHRYLKDKESWWENHLQYTTATGRRRLSSLTNGSYIGQSTTTTPS